MSALEQLVGNMTVAQLAEAAGLSLDDVVSLVLRQADGRAAPGRPKRREVRGSGGGTQSRAVAGSLEVAERRYNTRTRAERDALDEAIVSLLRHTGHKMRALDIRDAVGGTAAQVRTRLNVLIGEGKVDYAGKASGTRYWLK